MLILAVVLVWAMTMIMMIAVVVAVIGLGLFDSSMSLLNSGCELVLEKAAG